MNLLHRHTLNQLREWYGARWLPAIAENWEAHVSYMEKVYAD